MNTIILDNLVILQRQGSFSLTESISLKTTSEHCRHQVVRRTNYTSKGLEQKEV